MKCPVCNCEEQREKLYHIICAECGLILEDRNEGKRTLRILREGLHLVPDDRPTGDVDGVDDGSDDPPPAA